MARVKGTKNILSATAKENIIAVFTRLGGTSAMADWARENLSDFYKIYARLVPTAVDGHLEVKHLVTDERIVETRQILRTKAPI